VLELYQNHVNRGRKMPRENLQAMLDQAEKSDTAVREMLSVIGLNTEDLDDDVRAKFEEYWSSSNTMRGMIMAHVRT